MCENEQTITAASTTNATYLFTFRLDSGSSSTGTIQAGVAGTNGIIADSNCNIRMAAGSYAYDMMKDPWIKPGHNGTYCILGQQCGNGTEGIGYVSNTSSVSYTCPTGYTLSGTNCIKTITDTVVATSSDVCNVQIETEPVKVIQKNSSKNFSFTWGNVNISADRNCILSVQGNLLTLSGDPSSAIRPQKESLDCFGNINLCLQYRAPIISVYNRTLSGNTTLTCPTGYTLSNGSCVKTTTITHAPFCDQGDLDPVTNKCIL